MTQSPTSTARAGSVSAAANAAVPLINSRLFMVAAFALWAGVALAQNSFPTPGGQTVPGVVVMCITAGKAAPCSGAVTSGPDGQFVAPGGQMVQGRVRMCVNAGVATPC